KSWNEADRRGFNFLRWHFALENDVLMMSQQTYRGVRMKRYPLVIVSLTVLAAVSFVQSGSGSAETEVKDALEKYRGALMKRDAAALKQIWADDYTFINGVGQIVTKEQRLANLDSGATSLRTIDLGGEAKVRVYGGDVAIATSKVTIKGQYSGKESS